MEFERFLNKYLNGSLSDQELAQFRALLDRSPHYRDELRQILDLRSAIQDDALHLTPPESLSEKVRLSVAASFVDAKLGDRQVVVEDRRRRVIWSPYRMAGMVAVIMAVAIPFGPEVFKGAARRALQAPDIAMSIDLPRGASGVTAAADRSSSRSVPAVAGDAADIAALAPTAPESSPASSAADDVESARGNAESAAVAALPPTGGVSAEELPAEGGLSGSLAFGSDAVGLPAELSVGQGIFERSGLVSDDLQAMLKPRDIDALRGYSTSSERLTRRDDPIFAAARQDPFPQPTTGSGNARLLTVGVTLGSGQVSNAKSATALLQNSYYFAVNVSSRDRIGIEMGASAFEQVKNVISYSSPSDNNVSTAKRSAGQGAQVASARRSSAAPAGFLGKRSGTNPGDGTDVARLPEDLQGGFNYYPASDIVLPIGEYDPMRGYTPGAQGENAAAESDGPRAMLVEQRAEQQITYGAIFYDHSVELTRDLDLCGRLAVGGANDAIVGGLRAYAAYSPSKTLTFTLGVGGSTLYNLTLNKAGASSNYGIYYGIETGF